MKCERTGCQPFQKKAGRRAQGCKGWCNHPFFAGGRLFILILGLNMAEHEGIVVRREVDFSESNWESSRLHWEVEGCEV